MANDFAYETGFMNGFKAGVEATQPKWISVEERLPEKAGEVLIVVSRFVAVAWYHPKTRCFESGSGLCWFVSENAVTHWMPLPEPPKEDA